MYRLHSDKVSERMSMVRLGYGTIECLVYALDLAEGANADRIGTFKVIDRHGRERKRGEKCHCYVCA